MGVAQNPLLHGMLLLSINLDVFFRAAVGDSDHDAESEEDRESDQGPRRADARQDSQFPQRGQNTTYQDGESNKVHAHPFHRFPRKLASVKLRRTGEEYSGCCLSARGRLSVSSYRRSGATSADGWYFDDPIFRIA